MIALSVIFRKLLSHDLKYCCLCFQTIEDKLYTLQDEVTLYTENVDLYEILATVLSDQVVNNVSTNLICQKCVETVLNYYKFIEMCKNNVLNLARYINDLQKYTENMPDETEHHKSLFLTLDVFNKSINSIYDSKQHNEGESISERLKCLRQPSMTNIYSLITIELEHEANDNTNINENPLLKNKETLKSGQLSEIYISNKENDNNYTCKNCMKIYPTVLKIKQHYIRVHAPKDFKCMKCPRKFGSLLLLKRHSKDSHCTVMCSQCGKTYNNTYSLKHHERSHKERLVCQTCGKVYKGKPAFNNHIENKLCEKMRKSNTEAKFTCDYCGKKYSQKSPLGIHIRLEHENGKALICDWCGKKLSSISRLKDHIIKHTKQKNFNCDICGGKFASKASLLYHTRTHTGEKPYPCEHCDMRFLSASRRSDHVTRQHDSDRECDICLKKCKGQTALRRHRKQHFNVSSRLFCKPSVSSN